MILYKEHFIGLVYRAIVMTKAARQGLLRESATSL